MTVEYMCTRDILTRFDSLIKNIEEVRDRASHDKHDLATTYSSVDPDIDARITSFHKMINVMNTLQLSLTFVTKHLLVREWWQAIAREDMPDSAKKVYVERYLDVSKIGYVQALFSAVESSFRLFLRALDPGACRSGMAEFKAIYDYMLSSKLQSPPPDASDLLDLFRLIRNTVHNNGVYFNPNGGDATVSLRGITYQFKQGVPVDFVSFEFLIEQTDNLRQLVRDVVLDPAMLALTAEIEDPYFSAPAA